MKQYRLVLEKEYLLPEKGEEGEIKIEKVLLQPDTKRWTIYGTKLGPVKEAEERVKAFLFETVPLSQASIDVILKQEDVPLLYEDFCGGLRERMVEEDEESVLPEEVAPPGDEDYAGEEEVPYVHVAPEILKDEAYLKACKAVAEGPKGGSKKGATSSLGKDGAIIGRRIKGEPRPLEEIREEDRNVIISGKIVGMDARVLRTSRVLLTMQVADKTSGITLKKFFETEEEAKVLQKLQNGTPIVARGDIRFDTYANDYAMMLSDLQLGEEEASREDRSEEKRVELHLHTKMSMLDGLIDVKQLIKTVKKWGHPAVAITDHGVVQAFPEAQVEAARNGVKIIYGMEGYIFDEDIKRSHHIILLAKNTAGLRNLYRLVSISHLKFIHKNRARIPRDLISEYRDGLIIGSACAAGEVMKALIHCGELRKTYATPEGAVEAIFNCPEIEEIKRTASFYDYLEIQPVCNNDFLVRTGEVYGAQGLQAINMAICRLGEELGKPVVATCDAHFLNPEDQIYREILISRFFADADKQPPIFLRTTEEMLGEFTYLGEEKAREVVITNPNRINDEVEHLEPVPKETLYSPKIDGAEEALRSMCYKKAHEWYGDPLPKIVQDRLEYELGSIIGHGFGVLYYIAHQLVKKSLDDNYLVGSRGSVGSSFVATMADITEVNPLPPHYRCPNCRYSQFIEDGSVGGGFDLEDKDCPECGTAMKKDGHDIPFAIFLGFDGDKVPDIDLNFSGEYQPKAHKYTEELFGKDNVFRAGTIGTIQDKTAFGYVKKYTEKKGVVCNTAYASSLIHGFTKVKNTTGQHPGGVMVVPRGMDIHHFTPVQYPANKKESGTITTHFDYHSFEGRLVKLDILGHDDPTIIRMLEDLTGVNARTIPFDDKATMSLFSTTKALGLDEKELGSPVGSFGVPEFGTRFVRQMLEDTKPQTFSELVRISGFSHGTNVWLDNAQDLIKNGVVKLNEAISTRDDIMNYLIQKGVEPIISFKVMENVRKGNRLCQKKTDIPLEKEIQAMKAKNVPEWFFESCRKISYLFPRAHAVAYVMMAFRIAWFKINYPLAYYATYFTIRAKEFDSQVMTKGAEAIHNAMKAIDAKGLEASEKEKGLYTSLELAYEMALRGYSFLNVDIHQSHAYRFTIRNNKILPPLCAIDGLGDSAAEVIVKAREQSDFVSKADLKSRGKVSQSVMDLLEAQGCLDDLPEDLQMDLFAM